MSVRYNQVITLETEECCNCGLVFAMPADFMKRRRKDRKTFYCPAGHGQHYTSKTEEQKLRERAEREEARRIQAEYRAASAARAHQKMRNRIKNGVCPCCNRTFTNLMQHMKTQHPDFGSREMLRPVRTLMGLSQQNVADEAGVSAPQVSAFERTKPVAAWAAQKLEDWLLENTA